MAAYYVPSPGLAARVAAAIAPQVGRYAGEVADAARVNAPDGKAWMTSEDERVRPSHRDTDGQEVPANLRYQLPRYRYIRGSHGKGYAREGGVDLGREPRDPNLPIEQRINCRCESVDLPGAIARKVTASDARVEGQRAVATVSVKYPRVAESEHPDPEDSGGGWFRRAALTVAAQHRAR